MGIYLFKNITQEHSYLGGKGFALGLMKNAGFPVPDGLILDSPPSKEELVEIFEWWKKNNNQKLAVRSSAVGEDSSEQSFAGQNSTYLNISSEKDLEISIKNCFSSVYKKSSSLYREHFLGSDKALMNVVLQVMVDPLYSGVFFSTDPRNGEKNWIVESIEGLGEDLVSGKTTPLHFEEKKINNVAPFDLQELTQTGMKVRDFFKVEIDMEWSIDHQHQLFVLQARPITALSGKSEAKRIIEEEISRLKSHYPSETLWDGGTFAEWSGPPSELTFSIWKEAFSKNHAFSKALKKLGYLGIDEELNNKDHSLLERVFNRGYVNITMLAPFYFGPIPYRLKIDKVPKLAFDLKKMTFKTFILTPKTLWRMMKVGMGLSTQRGQWLKECAKEMVLLKNKTFRVQDASFYEKHSNEELLEHLEREVREFYDSHLVWPLLLVTLIETTTQNLKSLLKGLDTEKNLEHLFNRWMALGLHTVTMDMNNDYRNASVDASKQQHFLLKYGHRGPGELELSNPRWSELKEKAFLKVSINNKSELKNQEQSVEKEIDSLKTYKKEIIKKEWILLKEMLELREQWKMLLLSPYSHIRFIALEISRRNNLGDAIFWLNFQEILAGNLSIELAKKRKKNSELSKSISLPTILELAKIEEILKGEVKDQKAIMNGLALSPGLTYGEVRVVLDPDNVDTDSWPEKTILVAESTDPGWTGLFLKASAIIVDKGGVLSHCAIVAREMNLPAVSEIKQCHLKLKNGDKIWVDGNNGRITLVN
ncbi:phosphoenolpyruvate synthase [Bacteriovorax stolpii]|uniref:PEP/pyruvate-binding domain-containing protein n=1 Tax=Bacteriovorax stolpii TaxID=960 RepID=UPI00115BFA49|nr:PEP/pyruvate-binding domain-containing protein [Bacteriovorax stolpii]QDK41995.1 phosphoenolpyruvate synthase [Bacteriovorax stolpii]